MPLQWRDRGHDVRFLLFSWQEPNSGTAYRFLKEQGFAVSATNFRDTFTNVRWLLEQTRNARPDVFLANHVVPAWHAAGFLRKAGIPTIGILRSDDAFYHDLTEGFVFGPPRFRPNALVTVSRHLAEKVESRLPSDTLVRTIPSGSPVLESLPERLHSPFRIAYVGRLAQEQKRIHETVEALVAATAGCPDTEAVLFGDGPERDWVRERLQRADATKVSWEGSLSPEEIPSRLASCHAIVLLSDYEGTPTAIMEGMAAGCIPITTAMESGIPELVEHQETGILVADRKAAFVSAVRQLVEDEALRRRLSHAAREKVKTSFSLEHCADRWTDLFDQLSSPERENLEIVIPRRIHLPRPLPGFAHQDPRPPSIRSRFRSRLSRLRFHAGKWRRTVFPAS